MEEKQTATHRQLAILLGTIENDMSFYKVTNNRHDMKWNLLTEKLNSLPNGAKKSVAGWKTVLNDWKLSVSSRAEENPGDLNEFETRVLNIIEDRRLKIVDGIDKNLVKLLRAPRRRLTREARNENDYMGAAGRSSALRNRAGITARQEAITLQNERLQAPRTIYTENMLRNSYDCPAHRITVMHLERLHYVSQDLECHIKNVQDRIQMIKDRWQHDCEDEE